MQSNATCKSFMEMENPLVYSCNPIKKLQLYKVIISEDPLHSEI